MARQAMQVLLAASLLFPSCLVAQREEIRLRIDAGEAEAALAVLDARAAGGVVPDSLWRRLEQSEGFGRLAEREQAMGRPLTMAMPELPGRERWPTCRPIPGWRLPSTC